MRDALAAMGGDPSRANPLLPADLVIDHSVQVDHFRRRDAFDLNAPRVPTQSRALHLLRWGQTAFRNSA
jgi:aconitate hydratase